MELAEWRFAPCFLCVSKAWSAEHEGSQGLLFGLLGRLRRRLACAKSPPGSQGIDSSGKAQNDSQAHEQQHNQNERQANPDEVLENCVKESAHFLHPEIKLPEPCHTVCDLPHASK